MSLCENWYRELKRDKEELWKLNINPRKLFSEIGDLARWGMLKPEHVRAMVHYLKDRYNYRRCIYRYYPATIEEVDSLLRELSPYAHEDIEEAGRIEREVLEEWLRRREAKRERG